jgi:hypothetical protein
MFFRQPVITESMEGYHIGGHVQVNIRYLTWFKESFYDLREDLGEAKAAGKQGMQ